MSVLSRSLAGSACLTLVFIANVANAVDARERLRAIAQESQKLMEQIYVQVRTMQGYNIYDPANPSASRVLSGGKLAVMNLQRDTQRLADLGSEASSRAAKCDKSVRDIVRDFQSQTRRVNSAAQRLQATRDDAPSGMALDQIEFALKRAAQIAPALGAVTECWGDEEPEDEEEEKKKGTEEYNDT